MKVAAGAIALLCAANFAFAERRVSVKQLEVLLTAAGEYGKRDANIARGLADVELTERITDTVLSKLLAECPGPRTSDALQILAAASAFLDAPADERLNVDAPTTAEQTAILVRAKDYAARYVAGLPNFLCTRATRHFYRRQAWQGFRLSNTDIGQLSFSNGVESYVSDTAAGQTASVESQSGLTTFGEFGSMLGALFTADSAPSMEWSHWETVNGVRTAVFRYSVSADRSRFTVGWCCPQNSSRPAVVRAAYKGWLYIEPVSGAALRVTRQALELPKDFGTRESETVVDYRNVRIGSRVFLCPVRSVTLSDATFHDSVSGKWRVEYLNDVRFVHYRKFGAEAKLMADSAPAAGETEPSEADEPSPWQEPEPAEDLIPEQPEAPEPPASGLTIRTTTRLVEVPVIVRDKRGAPITGLKREDFTIFDNGRPQDIAVFVGENGPAGAVPASNSANGRRVFSNREETGGAADHVTVILMDELNTDWADMAFARQQLLKFLRGMPPGAPVGIYLLIGNGYAVLHDFTRASGPLVRRLASYRGKPDFTPEFANGHTDLDLQLANWLSGESPGSRAHQFYSGSGALPEMAFGALASLAKRLRGVPGRKDVIWISSGFAQTYEGFGGPVSDHSGLVKTVRSFNDANAALYFVDPAGLEFPFVDASVGTPKGTGGAHTYNWKFVKDSSTMHTLPIEQNQSMGIELSAKTGGRAFVNTNDISGAIGAAFDDSHPSYRLGFYPRGLVNDGKYHEITVKLKDRPDARLRWRHGYFDAPLSEPPKEQLRDALRNPVNAVGIPLSAELTPSSSGYELKLDIGLTELALAQQGDRWNGKVEIALMQCDEDGEQLERLEQTLGLKLKNDSYAAMMKDGFSYRHSFRAKNGAVSLRVAVRSESGELGTLTAPLR